MFKCSKCHVTKPEDEFNLGKKGQRLKTCSECDEYKAWYKAQQKAKNKVPIEITDEWHEHPTFKGYYANASGSVLNGKTKRLIGKLHCTGYILLSLHVPELKMMRCHRFVWECFNGLIIDDKVINHKDEDKTNNSIDNLELVTQSENMKKLSTKIRGPKLSKACLGYLKTSTDKTQYISLRDAERRTGCPFSSIHSVCDGITNTVASKTTGDIWIFRYV